MENYPDDKYYLIWALRLLKQCDQGPYVKDALAECVVVQEGEVGSDGACLMEELEMVLSERYGINPDDIEPYQFEPEE